MLDFSEPELFTLLAQAGIPVAVSRLAADADEAARAAAGLGTPEGAQPGARLVLKAGGLEHKTDDGGVVLGLNGPGEVRTAAAGLLSRLGARALPLIVQRQHEGHEMLAGLRREPGVGAVVVVGTGGIHTEVVADAVDALVPLDRAAAEDLVRRHPLHRLLAGHRGSPALDVPALVDLLVALSELAERRPDIGELDLNPVLMGRLGEGVIAVDARMATIDAPPVRRPAARAGPAGPARLDPLLRPRHIAVVGVSDDPAKTGARIYRYLTEKGFTGRVDAVHPSGGEIGGRPRHRSLAAVPGVPDLVCIAVPAKAVPDVAREAAALGAGAAIVHSSGFAETGPDGERLQREVAAIFHDAGIPLAGPNSMGVVVPETGMAASLSGALEADELAAGGVALISSSGALGSCVASRLMEQGVGLSRWVHLGNEADLDVAAYLEWLAHDPKTEVVGLLLENVTDGDRLIRAGRELAARGKPLFAFNMVRSQGARAATRSHTGALVGSHRLRAAVLDAASATRVPTLRVLQDALILASSGGLPRGNRLLAVAASGGACTIIADGAETGGIALPPFPDGVRERVAGVLPDFVAPVNPLDMSAQIIGRPEVLGEVLEHALDDSRYDAALVQLTTNADPGAELTAKVVVAVRQRISIPLYVARFGAESLAPAGMAAYAAAGIPVLDAPDRTMDALAAVVRAAGKLREGSWSSH
ncbi:acetate--CoA ligase family protein [Actinomadura sp. KC06]|uniref:acetate--CoA ligase family protein n=1 Tax=Actinomadura sp. KC06 TaxID=2530369 RepID=UPI00140448FB|nr:acetate--CoA ligase family protein [Actinomadura sp. KC06]